jgi:murein L,D-transpeptidase YafK
MSRWLKILLFTVLACAICGSGLYVYGRALWHPVLMRLVGGRSEGDALADIRARKPTLDQTPAGPITLIAYKHERELELYIGHTRWRTISILAASGTSGPKLRAGDGQVPEGIYDITAANANSAYYLSLRVGYPNAADRARSQALGISDPGGDIYIHGHAASIGCLAIGNDAIEDVFYLVVSRGIGTCHVIIAPGRQWEQFRAKEPALYAAIAQGIADVTAP